MYMKLVALIVALVLMLGHPALLVVLLAGLALLGGSPEESGLVRPGSA